MKTALYRHWGENDELLYVGISLSATQRAATHRSNGSHWIGEIVKMTVEWFDTRQLALAAETAAIASERPKYNIQKVPRAHEDANTDIDAPEARFIDAVSKAISEAGASGATRRMLSHYLLRAGLCDNLTGALEIMKKSGALRTEHSRYGEIYKMAA